MNRCLFEMQECLQYTCTDRTFDLEFGGDILDCNMMYLKIVPKLDFCNFELVIFLGRSIHY